MSGEATETASLGELSNEERAQLREGHYPQPDPSTFGFMPGTGCNSVSAIKGRHWGRHRVHPDSILLTAKAYRQLNEEMAGGALIYDLLPVIWEDARAEPRVLPFLARRIHERTMIDPFGLIVAEEKHGG